MTNPLISTLIAIGRDGAERAMDIRVAYDRPWGWSAVRENYEGGDLIGRGDSAEAAIEDLLTQEADRE